MDETIVKITGVIVAIAAAFTACAPIAKKLGNNTKSKRRHTGFYEIVLEKVCLPIDDLLNGKSENASVVEIQEILICIKGILQTNSLYTPPAHKIEVDNLLRLCNCYFCEKEEDIKVAWETQLNKCIIKFETLLANYEIEARKALGYQYDSFLNNIKYSKSDPLFVVYYVFWGYFMFIALIAVLLFQNKVWIAFGIVSGFALVVFVAAKLRRKYITKGGVRVIIATKHTKINRSKKQK